MLRRTAASSPMKVTLVALLILATLVPARAADRIAFVVGVDTYTKLAPEAQLKVAVSDAERMAGTLEALDPPFSVTLLKDADWKSAQDEFDAFLTRARDAECALVYFAGHGIEYHGENFLLVKDTDVADISADVERMKRRLSTAAVSLQGWVDSLDSTRAQVKLVILDCCRDNPLKADDGSGSRSVVGGSRGLAQVTPPSGTLISYSADAGQQANDGLFTEVLTNNLKTPGLNIVKVFAKTREEVREISESWAAEDAAKGLAPAFRRPRHEPAEYNKLNLAGTDFAFTRGVPDTVNAGSSTRMTEAEIERRAREMAAKLVAESMKNQPSPMAKTDPMPEPASPASRGMEGAQAGEVRVFGGIEMVWCPPGEFLMGSPENEWGRQEDETQRHVVLTKGFWLAKTECTQAQWTSVMGTDLAMQMAKGNSYGELISAGATYPMYFVSWNDTLEYVVRMNTENPLPEGWKWTLPTEAQWEYACRAGTESAVAGITEEMAWYDANSGGKANPVGIKKTNAWGLHDMDGNVWEWCLDWYGGLGSGSEIDPRGADSGVDRVYRGGSWRGLAQFCRSAERGCASPLIRFDNLGFRPAVVSSTR